MEYGIRKFIKESPPKKFRNMEYLNKNTKILQKVPSFSLNLENGQKAIPDNFEAKNAKNFTI